MGFIRKYPIAVISSAMALLLFPVQMALDLDIFESLVYRINTFYISSDAMELDEALVSIGLLLAGVALQGLVGKLRKIQEDRVRAEKLKTMRSTMYTVKDLVFNSFNAFELVILEAEQKGVDRRTISEFEASMHDTVRKINDLIELDEVRDKRIFGCVTVIDKPGHG